MWTHAVRGNEPALHEDRMPELRLRYEAQKKLALPRQLALRRRPLREGARVLQQQKAHRSARACLERRRFGAQLMAKAFKQKLRGSCIPHVRKSQATSLGAIGNHKQIAREPPGNHKQIAREPQGITSK